MTEAGAVPALAIASASGNTFAYAWGNLPGIDGAAWAREVCPALGLDGLFLLARPVPGAPWVMEHWDADGASTFCSNGTRAALAVPGSPEGPVVQVVSNGQALTLRRDGNDVALRLPSGPATGFRSVPAALGEAIGREHAFGWIGNPQLVILDDAVDTLDLPALAPALRAHPALPGGANVNFVQVLAPGTARIRSWERGVEGETLCCGTGCSVAGAWLARRTGLGTWRFLPQGEPVTVTVLLEGDGWRELWLAGPVQIQGGTQAASSLLS